jgi:hypothetical protein
MVTASYISRLSQAVEQIETRLKRRPLKVATVRCGVGEDRNAARERHYAIHPEDKVANITVFEFYDDEEIADASPDCSRRPGN